MTKVWNDQAKNLISVPREIFTLGLEPGEIAAYLFLLSIADYKTHTCYPSYKTIGNAIGRNNTSVGKYIRGLEEKDLIYSEPTTIIRQRDGRERNGSLLYTIRPIEEAVAAFLRRQAEENERRRMQAKLDAQEQKLEQMTFL